MAKNIQPENVLDEYDNEAIVRIDGENILIHANNLNILENLGRGKYGTVDLMCDRKSEKTFAVKKMTLARFAEGQRRSMMEIYVAMRCRDCPFTVNFYGALAIDDELWMLMERMDMSLDKLRESISTKIPNYHVPEKIVGSITYQIIMGLNYLRAEINVLHNDVKPSNILINKSGQVKVCDFGICGILTNGSFVESIVGSKPYLAPEKIFPKENQIGSSSRGDVWSLGITILEFATGKFPYRHWMNDFEILTDIVYGESPELPSGIYSDDFNDYINSSLKKEPEERPRHTELLQKQFVLGNQHVDISSFVAEFSTQ